ncbi:MAG: TylF/MycF family methyltransferase [Candidatus Calescibacterium sp.]|nr:TylF/MycF family methyltransferase [Candidatus Calescibacterium sp.]MDW8087805.1 TylF/MycF/NovP-related O-methyltransferase [Candidatus Calescibacterium sp.]
MNKDDKNEDEEVERFCMLDPRNQTEKDREFSKGMAVYFKRSIGSTMDKLRNFTKYVPRQTLSLFLAKNEIFKKIIGIHGYIIECGVFLGGGLMAWAQLSAIYEPYNHIRRVVGFDTFTGFPELSDKDKYDPVLNAEEGGLATYALDDIKESIRLYDLNRPIGHIPRVEIVVGDALKTIPDYVKNNPHLVVALLYLDFDLYEPTKVAIENFLPRMPKGAVIAFDELNQASWPGETLAVLETIGIRNLKIERFPFAPQISFAVLD